MPSFVPSSQPSTFDVACPQGVTLITMGDPAGIGPEIVAMAFRDHPELTRHCVVAGDVATMRRAAKTVGGAMPVAHLPHWHPAHTVPPRCLPVWQACTPEADPETLPAWGQVSAQAGRMAAQCIAAAARAALASPPHPLGAETNAGHVGVRAVVTAPIHKEALAAAGIPHPGHTEYLQALAAEHLGCAPAQVPVRMMLANPELQTVLVSIHVSLRQALDAVTVPNLLETLRLTHTSLSRSGQRLKIAVAGLNPHAGEGGLFGREELEVVAPAVAQAQALGWDVHGPFAPDTVFMRARQGEFDVVVALYHDQGLIPVKYLGVDHGVNITLGLPFVRTSPDHGTAFDLAGTGRANPASLLSALTWAQQRG